MAEEEKENKISQEKTDLLIKMDATMLQVATEAGKLVVLEAVLSAATFAGHVKTKVKSTAESIKEGTRVANEVCKNYRVKGKERKEIIKQTEQTYKEALDKIDAEFASKEAKLEEQRRQQTDGYLKEIVKLVKAYGEYVKIKTSAEYRDFRAISDSYEELKKAYENSKTIPTEDVQKMLAELKEKEPKNPLTKCTEEIKNIQSRLKGTYKANEEHSIGMKKLREEAEARNETWKEEKSKALVDKTKEFQDLKKPTAGHRVINFFSGTKKRAARAGEVMKTIATSTVRGVERACNYVGTGITNKAITTKEAVVRRYESVKQKRADIINSIYATLKTNYQTKETKLNEIRGKAIPVPKEKPPIKESGEDTKIEMVDTAEKTGRPGSTAEKDTEKGKGDSGDMDR